MWMAITSLDVFIAGIGFGFLDTVFFKTFIVILLITPGQCDCRTICRMVGRVSGKKENCGSWWLSASDRRN